MAPEHAKIRPYHGTLLGFKLHSFPVQHFCGLAWLQIVRDVAG